MVCSSFCICLLLLLVVTATPAPRPLPGGRVRKALPRPAVLGGRAKLRVRSAGLGREQPPPPQQEAVRASGPDHGGRALGQAAVALAAAAVVSLAGFSAGDVSPLPTLPARAESLTVAFPESKACEIFLDSIVYQRVKDQLRFRRPGPLPGVRCHARRRRAPRSAECAGGCYIELNAGYAADRFVRACGVGTCAVTFNDGGISVLIAIAGAYSEIQPVIFIAGGPKFKMGIQYGDGSGAILDRAGPCPGGQAGDCGAAGIEASARRLWRFLRSSWLPQEAEIFSVNPRWPPFCWAPPALGPTEDACISCQGLVSTPCPACRYPSLERCLVNKAYTTRLIMALFRALNFAPNSTM